MGDLVPFDPKRAKPKNGQIDLFERWKELNAKAQETAELSDAIAAGIAWREWLESFMAIA